MEGLFDKKTAVIVIDVQNDYVDEKGIMGKFLGTKRIQKVVPKMEKFLDSVRKSGVPVVHIQMTEGKDHIDEVLKKKRMSEFGGPENWELAVPGTWGYELVLKIGKNEKIFKKNTYDVFSNPELKKYLDKLGVETLILFGGYTHACVESSVRSAFTLGYDVVLATDLVGSPDVLWNAHESSLQNLTKLFAYGMTSKEIVEKL